MINIFLLKHHDLCIFLRIFTLVFLPCHSVIQIRLLHSFIHHCALCIRLTATKSHLIENLRIQFGYNYQPERTFKVGFSKSVRSSLVVDLFSLNPNIQSPNNLFSSKNAVTCIATTRSNIIPGILRRATG